MRYCLHAKRRYKTNISWLEMFPLSLFGLALDSSTISFCPDIRTFSYSLMSGIHFIWFDATLVLVWAIVCVYPFRWKISLTSEIDMAMCDRIWLDFALALPWKLFLSSPSETSSSKQLINEALCLAFLRIALSFKCEIFIGFVSFKRFFFARCPH